MPDTITKTASGLLQDILELITAAGSTSWIVVPPTFITSRTFRAT